MITSTPTVVFVEVSTVTVGLQVGLPTPVVADIATLDFPVLKVTMGLYDIWNPILSNHLPAPGASDVAVDSTIQVSMEDVGLGIDLILSNLQISYAGPGGPWVTVWTYAGGFATGYDGPSSLLTGLPALYTFVIDPTTSFDYVATIYVRGNLTDRAGNTAQIDYSFITEADTEAPIFSGLSPIDFSTDVVSSDVVYLELTDNYGVDPTKTVITVGGTLVYSNEVPRAGFGVTRTAIPGGYSYTITGPTDWSYGSTVYMYAYGEDVFGTGATATWQFSVEDNPTCFDGPLNNTENGLLISFPRGPLETLRSTLIRAANPVKPVAAARAIFLVAHERELAPLLFAHIAPPTAAERAVKLCYRATNYQISETLRRKERMITDAVRALQPYVTSEQYHMFMAYSKDDQPLTRVHLAAVIVLLAKALT